MLKIKTEENNKTIYYTVYWINESLDEFSMEWKTKFLIYNSTKGFHWIDSSLCKPV